MADGRYIETMEKSKPLQYRINITHTFYVTIPEDCEDVDAFLDEQVAEELRGCDVDYEAYSA